MVMELLEAFRVGDRLIGWHHKFRHPCNFGILGFIHKQTKHSSISAVALHTWLDHR